MQMLSNNNYIRMVCLSHCVENGIATLQTMSQMMDVPEKVFRGSIESQLVVCWFILLVLFVFGGVKVIQQGMVVSFCFVAADERLRRCHEQAALVEGYQWGLTLSCW